MNTWTIMDYELDYDIDTMTKLYDMNEPEEINYESKPGKHELDIDRGRVRGNLCGISYLGRIS